MVSRLRRPIGSSKGLGIQSKLLIALLIVSVLSVLVAGSIGYVSGTNSLRAAEFARMTQHRESRAREITEHRERRPFSPHDSRKGGDCRDGNPRRRR